MAQQGGKRQTDNEIRKEKGTILLVSMYGSEIGIKQRRIQFKLKKARGIIVIFFYFLKKGLRNVGKIYRLEMRLIFLRKF